MNENKDENENKELEVVTGNGKELNISPVYDHIKIDKPSKNKSKSKKVVIPDTKK